jgi:hypothetical protein
VSYTVPQDRYQGSRITSVICPLTTSGGAPHRHQGSKLVMGNQSCCYSCYDMRKPSLGLGSNIIAAWSSSSTVTQSGDDESYNLAENKSQEQKLSVYPSKLPVYPSDRQPCGHDEAHGTDFHQSKSSESNFEGASDREARCEQAILRRMSSSCVREEAEDPVFGSRSRED